MDCKKFVEEQIAKIKQTVGESRAINALSGGVDSSLVTVLGHRAIGDQLKTVFVDSALMREGEPQRVVDVFASLGIPVELDGTGIGVLAGFADPDMPLAANITYMSQGADVSAVGVTGTADMSMLELEVGAFVMPSLFVGVSYDSESSEISAPGLGSMDMDESGIGVAAKWVQTLGTNGSAVNVAARLAGEASANEALVSWATRTAARDSVNWSLKHACEIVLRGVERPIAVWSLKPSVPDDRAVLAGRGVAS